MESATYLAGLEEKLGGLQTELRDLEEKYNALLLRLQDCCKNDTYIAGLIHDRVNAILADVSNFLSSKCSKISNTFLFLFSNKCWFSRLEFTECGSEKQGGEDPDQTASSEAV